MYIDIDTKKIEIMNCQRIDIFIRLLFIENYYKKNDFGINLYKKMYNFKQTDFVNKFIKLIESFETNSFDKNISKVPLTDTYELYGDGAHRLACSIYFNIEKMHCNIKSDDNFTYNNQDLLGSCRRAPEHSAARFGYDFINKRFNKTEKVFILKSYEKYLKNINKLNVPINLENNSLERLKHIK